MEKFKEYSATIVGAAIGLGLLWFFAARDFNPVTLPYEAARWGFRTVVSLVSAAPPERVWLVVRFTLPDGKAAGMSFDNPDAPNMTLAECESSKDAALPFLAEHIKATTGGGSAAIVDVECVVSAGDPMRP